MTPFAFLAILAVVLAALIRAHVELMRELQTFDRRLGLDRVTGDSVRGVEPGRESSR